VQRALLRLLARRGIGEGTVVELGAGSGRSSRVIADAGFDVIGVDLSEPMLSLARAHAPTARFERGSAWDVALPPCVAVTAIGEVFCYAGADERPDLGALERRFADIHHALAADGVLLFDVSGPGRSGPGGRRLAVWDRPEAFLCMEETEADGTLVRRLHTFAPEGGLFRRVTETHRLVAYPPEDVVAALERNAYDVDRLEGYDGRALLEGWHAFAATKRPSVPD
jgi:SAM-dependent methyltransferase